MRRSSILVVVALATTSVQAQETFQFVGGGGAHAWENAAVWSGGSGLFSQWPGEMPAPATRDSAEVVGNWGGDLDLQIATPVVVDVLRMGSTGFGETLLSGSGSLTTNRIEPAGGVFATNRIAVDLLLDGDLELTNATTALTLDGRIVNGSPSGAARTLLNGTDRTLHVNGDVLLSDTPGAPGHLRFENKSIAELIVAGTISDGDAPGGSVTYARGRIEVLGDHTYSGRTELGSNHPDVGSEHIIHTDMAFGTSRLVFTGGTALKVLRGAGGKGTRTLANDLQVAREAVFAGPESFVLNGTVWQSSGRALINNLAPTASLTINGDIYASDSNDVREWVFDGPGRTVVNGVIDDSLSNANLTGATVTHRGTGRVVFTNPGVAAYTGRTRVDGMLQLGDGQMPVGLNGDVVNGDGTLEIDHAGTLDFDTQINGGLLVRHVGEGVTTLTRSNGATGGYEVVSGTLVVNGSIGDVEVGGVLAGDGSTGGVDVLAGGVVAPGSGVGSLAATGVSFAATSSLQIDVGASGADLLAVSGAASLAGTLTIELPGGPADPLAEYLVLSAASVSGELSNAPNGARVATADRSGSFVVGYQATSLTLSEFALAGDFNDDGRVDAADYTVWRDAVGQAASSLPNDVDGGVVGPAQHATWAANYGAALSPPPASLATPEPAAGLLAAFATLVGGLGRRRIGNPR